MRRARTGPTRGGTMPDRATGRPPRVSVVIPTRNRAEWLPRAVGSVLAQTWTDFELLIVDDHSTTRHGAIQPSPPFRL